MGWRDWTAMGGALATLASTTPAAAAVAQFRAGPDRAGVFAGEAPALNHLRWSFKTGGQVVASPTVVDGVVYVGSRDGYFYALDESDGAVNWRFKADAPITSSAAVVDGVAYVQSDANTLYALRDGAALWTHAGRPTLDFANRRAPFNSGLDWDYWTSSPLYADGRVYVGSGDGGVYAVAADSGREIWRFETKGRVRASPSTDGARIYVGGFDGRMYALDPATGGLIWSFKTAGNSYFPVGEIQSTAAVSGGLVLFGSRDYNLYALRADSGQQAWRTLHEESWVAASPAVRDGRVCVGSSDAQFIQCDDLATGKELWRNKLGANVFSSAAIVGDRLYAGNFAGQVVGLNLSDGKQAVGAIVDDRTNSSPWIDDGALFIGSNNGYVYAFDTRLPPATPAK